VSSCAVHSLPSSSAEAARVHAAHVAHADDSDALVGLHGDDGGGVYVSGLNFTRYATSSEVVQPMVGKRERDGVDAAVEEKSRAQTLAGSTAHKRISPSSKKLCPPFSTLLTIPKSQSLIPQPTCLPRRRSSAVRRRTSR
jgi:hypothetical protein